MAQFTRVFALPRDKQIKSRLVQLPGELRLKILRNLLKAATPLPNLELWKLDQRGSRRTAQRTYREKTQLSAQLLSTCQELFGDAFEVLYSENVLTMSVVSTGKCSWDKDHFITILDRSFTIEDPYDEEVYHYQEHLRETVESFFKRRIDHRDRPLAYFINAVEHMRRIEVILTTDNCSMLDRVCLQLKCLMDNKAVIIKQGSISLADSTDAKLTLSANDFTPCRVLRCPSLTIELRGVVTESEQASLEEIKTTVQSNSTPPDLWTDWIKINDLHKASGWLYSRSTMDSLHCLRQEITTAALRLEQEKFKQLVSKYVDNIRLAADNRVRQRTADLREAKDSAGELAVALKYFDQI